MASSPELLGRLDPSASTYLQALRERVVIFDGAMGTNLQLLGLGPDDFGGPELEGCNEVLVESKPELVAQVHRSFFDVGCDVVETDTFGSTSVVLAEYGLADRARERSPPEGCSSCLSTCTGQWSSKRQNTYQSNRRGTRICRLPSGSWMRSDLMCSWN